MSLTFKEIINNYRKQPQCKPQVFRSVFINSRNGVSWLSSLSNLFCFSFLADILLAQKMGQEHVDIITFYNEVFVPSVKPLLVEVGPDGISNKISKLTEERNNYDGTSHC